MSKLDAEEFCTLVRLFGDRVRIATDGSVTIERQTAVVHTDGEEARARPSGPRDR